MKALRVAVVGGAGRMGTELYHCLSENAHFEPSVSIDRNESNLFERSCLLEELKPDDFDALIDFSLPELTEQSLKWLKSNPRPAVIGTTGLSDQQHDLIQEVGQNSPILWSPNMSIGVAVLGQAMKLLARLEGFDFHITDFHHRHKKDNPSGTAKLLQSQLQEALGPQTQVPEPTGVRGGGIFGVHQVFAMSEEEVLCFEHQALNRQVFAKGAVRAMTWLRNQPPGCYSLVDLLEEK